MKSFFIAVLVFLCFNRNKSQSTLSPSDLKEFSGTKQFVQGFNNLYGNNILLGNSANTFSYYDKNSFNTWIDMERALVPGQFSKFYFWMDSSTPWTLRLHIWRISASFLTLVYDKRISILNNTNSYTTYEANVLSDHFRVTSNDRIGFAVETGRITIVYAQTGHSTFWTNVSTSYSAQPQIPLPTQFTLSEFPICVEIIPDTGDGSGQGIPGVAGVQGAQGQSGQPGPLGPPGPTGYPGQPGSFGAVGQPGLQGNQGSTGYTGFSGFTGSSGRTGFMGYMGSRGYTGSTGYPGPTGDTGYSGYIGPIGSFGDPGDTGPPGSLINGNGIPGVKGSTGLPGARGPTGPAGPPGDFVPRYLKGYSGGMGRTGSTGFSGQMGMPGQSGKIIKETIDNPYIKACYTPSAKDFESKNGFVSYPTCAGKPTTPILTKKKKVPTATLR